MSGRNKKRKNEEKITLTGEEGERKKTKDEGKEEGKKELRRKQMRKKKERRRISGRNKRGRTRKKIRCLVKKERG